MLRSGDGGQTWAYQPTPTDETLYAVSFADPKHGWAVGAAGVLLHSTDAGISWRALSVQLPADEYREAGPLDTPLFDVSAVSAHEAWAVGDFGIVLHTQDGVQWQQVALPSEVFTDDNLPDRILNAVDFSDRANGWIVGEFGTALRTHDGGLTWVGERSFSGVVEDVYLMDVAVSGDGKAISGGTGGVIIRTEDGGASWESTGMGSTAGLFGAAWRGDSALVVGNRGVIFATGDGGQTWSEPERPRSFNWLRAVAFGDRGRAFAVGQGGVILRSTDDGASWTRTGNRAAISISPELERR